MIPGASCSRSRALRRSWRVLLKRWATPVSIASLSPSRTTAYQRGDILSPIWAEFSLSSDDERSAREPNLALCSQTRGFRYTPEIIRRLRLLTLLASSPPTVQLSRLRRSEGLDSNGQAEPGRSSEPPPCFSAQRRAAVRECLVLSTPPVGGGRSPWSLALARCHAHRRLYDQSGSGHRCTLRRCKDKE